VLFEPRLRAGLVDGSISVCFRRWQRPQAVAGHRYRAGGGLLVEVDEVRTVSEADLTPGDARDAGFPSVDALLRDMPSGQGSLYRLALHAAAERDPRDELADDVSLHDLEALRDKLARLGDWPAPTLRAIGHSPGVRAADLARELGWPNTLSFKLHVRKLKALGLTISLERGYRLSARGEAFLGHSSTLPLQT
jgi:hypothetical protein